MKTLVNKLKIGVLVTGFVFLSSCTGNAISCSENGNNSEWNASPSIDADILKGNEKKVSLYFSYNSASNNGEITSLSKRSVHPNHFVTALPISFGPADAILITN
jgi:hypothetical protein